MTRGVSHRRVDSFNEFETASENNNWLRSRFFIPFYILLILGKVYKFSAIIHEIMSIIYVISFRTSLCSDYLLYLPSNNYN